MTIDSAATFIECCAVPWCLAWMRVIQTEASGFLRMLSTQPLTACLTLPPSISAPSLISSNSVATAWLASTCISLAASNSSSTDSSSESVEPAPGAAGSPFAFGAFCNENSS